MNPLLEKLISESPNILIDFYADWCEPCKWVVPVLEDVEKHFKEKIKVFKMDIDQHPELSKSLMILSVPTLILFVEQKEVWRLKGFDTASVLIKAIDKYMAA